MSKVLHRGENCVFLSETQPESVTVSAEKECFREPIKPALNARPGRRRRTMFFARPPHIAGRYAVAGEKEGKGPLAKYFHVIESDDKMHEKTFEKAEIDMLEKAVDGALASGGMTRSDVDILLAGDLLNQITTSSYLARDAAIPYFGVYSACSTMTESLALASALIDAGHFGSAVCATASHFATAERQYRYPLEYGCQRPPYSQWTVTAAGATVLSASGEGPRIVAATVGRAVDFGMNDLNNMGASMVPAALDSMCALFDETDTTPEDYDLIITGDLGKLGSDVLRDLMRERGYALGQNYIDCGTLVYDGTQKCYQGGSGAGCSASVFNSFVLDKVESGELNRVAYFATGALMSAQSCYQGETIPCISHGVIIER